MLGLAYQINQYPISISCTRANNSHVEAVKYLINKNTGA